MHSDSEGHQKKGKVVKKGSEEEVMITYLRSSRGDILPYEDAVHLVLKDNVCRIPGESRGICK
jgi:hypothetical protein